MNKPWLKSFLRVNNRKKRFTYRDVLSAGYMDRLDRFWLAHTAWSWFRCPWPSGEPE